MNFTLFMILLIAVPITIGLVSAKYLIKFKGGNIFAIILLFTIISSLFLAFGSPRVYVISQVDGVYTYYTRVSLFPFTHLTAEGKEIEVKPALFRCGVLNLTDSNLRLYPVYYQIQVGPTNDSSYFIPPSSYLVTNEWNVDVFPPHDPPKEDFVESRSHVYYVLSIE